MMININHEYEKSERMKTSAFVTFPVYLSNIKRIPNCFTFFNEIILENKKQFVNFMLQHFEEVGSEAGGSRLHLPPKNQFFLEHLLYLPWGFEHLHLIEWA